MQSFQLTSHIDSQGVLKIQLPENLASQDVDVVLVVEATNTDHQINDNKNTTKNTMSFGERLNEFLEEVETDPIDIDTSIFDSYRKTVTVREFTWED